MIIGLNPLVPTVTNDNKEHEQQNVEDVVQHIDNLLSHHDKDTDGYIVYHEYKSGGSFKPGENETEMKK